MPVRYEIDGDAGLVRVELSATLTTAEIVAYYAALGRDPAARGLPVLADGRTVTSVPAFAQLKSLASMRPHVPAHLRPLRVAVVVSGVWLFGIARQFGALVERVGLVVVPFYDLAEAEQSLDIPAIVGSQQTPW